VREIKSGEEKQLTAHGSAEYSFHRDAIRDRAVGMNYTKPDYPATLPHVYWSPDSKRLIALKTTVVAEPRVYMVESSPQDQQQPKLHSYPYIKPGDAIPQARVYLFDVAGGEAIPVDNALMDHPWSLGRFEWAEDSSAFRLLYNRRGHQVLRVLSIDGKSGAVKTLVEETSDTFINYSNKTHLTVMEERGEIVWMSERDGWNHLYLYDIKTGAVLNQITQGEWVVRGVDRVDEEAGVVYFRAMGIHAGQDPYHVHHARVNFDGSGLALLTEGDGTHGIEYSPDERWYVDTWSRVDMAPVHELRRARDGAKVIALGKADASEFAESGGCLPERFVAKGRDGETDIYGIIHRPINLDPRKKYPVVESIYAGPHGQHVPKDFRLRYASQRQIARAGYVVVQIDGMGTNWRSKAFHDVAWKDIADAGFEDRIAWMKAAAVTRPWMDITRVGIYGGSAGGQNAMRAVLDHADFYDAAAADCGCHDNRMDKIWWNEAWMGWPVDASYAQSSNVDDAHQLGGALLLAVGELDRNVDPASTMQVVDALHKAGKDFELLVIPGGGHGSVGSENGRRVRLDFFDRHLKGKR
jgi:dipeptidyl aminopeptidase/acylaminoacyl peptidase